MALYKKEPRPSLHGPVKQRSRTQTRDVYHNMEIKRDEYQRDQFSRIQDVYDAFYAGLDPRRRNEAADAGMVAEDPRAIANLSPVPIHREYPRVKWYTNPYIQDEIQE